ncbi:ATP-grasp domain-containing protein [Mesorhizobium sp.]|uniref:arsenate reductase/protein-tyrosine-phosphatase family protein n=1 Tax=Mesorhizobium sp. TaxID=1871066 RepID=UPI0012273E64|nr:ATP-grasp domain-containing protein [Mesorhizobium sp.]TIN11637.1 MAG: hypothetical protein E5Y14_04755 [Mesorhizobium sp.]
MDRALRVLLIGSTDRAGLSICRSLGVAGYRVSVIRLTTHKGLVERSRYCERGEFLGNPQESASAFQSALIAFLSSQKFDYVIPINDAACELLYSEYDAFSRLAHIVGPTPSAFFLAKDKYRSIEILKSVGVSSPKTIVVKDRGEGMAVASEKELSAIGFPCFAKPIVSCAIINDQVQSFSVRRVGDPGALEDKLRDDLARVPVLIQKPVSGPGVGLNFCSFEGKVLAISVTERVREPRHGGGSSYRRTGTVSEEVTSIVTGVASALKWTGFMMIECKQTEEGLSLMELNCRPWGSIPLSIFAGINYPVLLLNAFQELDQAGPTTIAPAGLYARNLAKDIGWLISNPARFPEWFWDLRRLISRKEQLDVEWFTDPRPTLHQTDGFIAEWIRRAGDRINLVNLISMWKRPRPDVLPKDSRILFVCRGNINRSPVSEALFREAGYSNVLSAGLSHSAGRRMSRFAASFLNRHLGQVQGSFRSKSLKNLDIDLSECIAIVFERRHVGVVARMRPELKGRVFLLSDIARSWAGGVNILDPHGGDARLYEECFNKIVLLSRMVTAQYA